MSIVQIGLVQMSCVGNKAANLDKAISRIRAAAANGAQIVCLQELFTSLYFCDVEDYDNFALAEAIPGPSTDVLSAVAAELNVVIIASLFEKNALVYIITPQPSLTLMVSIWVNIARCIFPIMRHFMRSFILHPGDLGYKVFQTKYAKIGVLICWDQWYPEASRITALMGADVMFYPTAIGWATTQDEETNTDQYNAWQTIQRSHAVANGIPVVSVNRVGYEQDGAMKFWGGSFVANGQGKLLYKASHEDEETKVVPVDLSQADEFRVHWPFLRDRRIDSYQPITKRFIDEA